MSWTWIPRDFLQIFAQNGFLGVIHKILAMDLAISPYDKAIELEHTLECAITAYEEQTEAEVEGRIKARKRYAIETAIRETQKGDKLLPHAPQLESGVLGKGTDQNAEVTKPHLAIRLYPESLSDTEIESSSSQPFSQRRNNTHQRLQTYHSSPNRAVFFKDEDFSILPQDKVHTKDNELKDTELEDNELESTSETRIHSDDEEALPNAMHPEELLSVFRTTGQSVPAHLSHTVEEFESSEDLLHPGSVDQNEEQGCRTSNYPGKQQAMEIKEKQQGEISSQGSNHRLEDNGETVSEHQLDGRATYVISHNVVPEPAVAMLEDTGRLPWEPQPELGYGNNGEVETPDPSSSAASPPYQFYKGQDQDEIDYWAFYGDTIMNVTFDMDQLVEPNSWITSRGTEQDEARLTERSDATTEPEEGDVEDSLQELDRASDSVHRLPVEENSEHSFQEVYQVNEQSIPSDNHRDTEEEASMSCETSFIPFDEHAQNDEQSNSHFSTSSSEIVQPQQSDQTPTFRSRSSSQNIETSRTYVIECSQDECLDRPHIYPCGTVTPSNRPVSMLELETEHVRLLYSTSPRPKQLDASEVKLGSHGDTSMTEVHCVIDRDDLSSSLSHTGAASDASVQLLDSEHEGLNDGLKSPLCTWKKRLTFSPGDGRSISPSATKCTTGRLPRIHSAPPSLSRPKLTHVTKVSTLPPIYESVVLLGPPIPSVEEKGMATRNTRSLAFLNTSANEYSVTTTPCTSQTNIRPNSPIKKRMKEKRAQIPNSSRGSNGQEGNVTLDRAIGKPPPSPSPSKSPQRSQSQTGSRPNSRYT